MAAEFDMRPTLISGAAPLVGTKPALQNPLERLAVLAVELIDQASLVGHVLGEGRVDERETRGRERDDATAPVIVRGAPLDKTRLDESVESLAHCSRRHPGVLGELAGGPLVRSASAAQGRKNVKLPLAQSVSLVDRQQLPREVAGQPMQSADDSLRTHIEIRPLGCPLGLNARNAVCHAPTVSSVEAIVASMEDKWRWMLVTAIAPVAWGSNYFVTAQFLPEGSPLWGATLRALPAGLLLVLLARTLPRGSWWWRSAVLGALNVGGFFILIYVASQLLPSSVAATIMATSAGVLMLLAWPLLGEQPRLAGILGAVLGFGGVCLLLVGDGVTLAPWGVAASLLAMLMSSTGFVLTKRWAPSESPLTVTSWQLVAGGLLVLPVAVLVEGTPPALDAPALAAFAYVIVVATALAFVAWFAGLRRLPAGTVGVIGLLNPVTGVLLGTMLAAEAFGLRQLLGTSLVVGGVIIASRQPSMRR